MRILRKGRETMYVWRNIQLYRSRVMLFSALFVLAVMLLLLFTIPYTLLGIILIPMSYLLGIYSYGKILAWESGGVGEAQVVAQLLNLSDRFVLISNITIPPNRGDVDHIVVGPNGLFVIEVKNISGVVSCKGDEWSRQKIGRRGTPYPLEMGSPSNQVKRNAKVLKDYLLSKKKDVFVGGRSPHIWVNAIVVFTHPKVVLRLDSPTVNILHPTELPSFIESEGRPLFSAEEVDKIGRILAACC
ncbi:Nuclease-related domain protein [uncultured archaeon]|nr:Nuclease-related domain protein [uncultured archaeon]